VVMAQQLFKKLQIKVNNGVDNNDK